MKDITSEINEANTSAALHEQIKDLGVLNILQPNERSEIYQAVLNHKRLDTVGIDLLIQVAHSAGDLNEQNSETYQAILDAYITQIPGTKKEGLIHLIEAVKTLPEERITTIQSQHDLGTEALQKNQNVKTLIKILYEVKEIENKKIAEDKVNEMQIGYYLFAKSSVLNELAKDHQTPTEILKEVFEETKKIKVIQTKGIILKNIAANPNTPSAVLGAIADDMNQVQNLANYQPNRQEILTALAANPNTSKKVNEKVQNAANPNTPEAVKQQMQNSVKTQPEQRDVSSKNPNTAESSKGISFVDRLKKSIGLGSNKRTR